MDLNPSNYKKMSIVPFSKRVFPYPIGSYYQKSSLNSVIFFIHNTIQCIIETQSEINEINSMIYITNYIRFLTYDYLLRLYSAPKKTAGEDYAPLTKGDEAHWEVSSTTWRSVTVLQLGG